MALVLSFGGEREHWQWLELQWIADRCACSMSLYVVCFGWGKPDLSVYPANEFFLRLSSWYTDTLWRSTVLVQCRIAYDSPKAVVIFRSQR